MDLSTAWMRSLGGGGGELHPKELHPTLLIALKTLLHGSLSLHIASNAQHRPTTSPCCSDGTPTDPRSPKVLIIITRF
ncbi:unnamed protein product [Larinioides sclopetarius]|uniref:Uncharacterized protein n=1 Tax=Larinioides sclopetarius TaxID=280406 RepID=A0AAV2BNN4_9ARAC